MKIVAAALLTLIAGIAGAAEDSPPAAATSGVDSSYSMRRAVDAIARHTDGAKQFLTLNLVDPPTDQIVDGLLRHLEFSRKQKLWLGVASLNEEWAVEVFTRAFAKKPKLKLQGVKLVIITATGDATRFEPLFATRRVILRVGSYEEEGAE